MKKVFLFFPGKFGTEKRKIYFMFATMSIATVVNVLLNGTILFYRAIDSEKYNNFMIKLNKGTLGQLFYFSYYLVTQWMPIFTIAFIHYRNFKVEFK